MQRPDDDARLLALQFTLSWWMAHTDPTRERPNIPDRDEYNRYVTGDASNHPLLVQSEVGFCESQLHGRNGCGPTNVKRELHLERLLVKLRRTSS